MNTGKLGLKPAFATPHTIADANNPFFKRGQEGMSKRFYVASLIASGLAANPKNIKNTTTIFNRIKQLFLPRTNIKSSFADMEDIAKISFLLTDALLEQENI